jgi:hypothetical protein
MNVAFDKNAIVLGENVAVYTRGIYVQFSIEVTADNRLRATNVKQVSNSVYFTAMAESARSVMVVDDRLLYGAPPPGAKNKSVSRSKLRVNRRIVT